MATRGVGQLWSEVTALATRPGVLSLGQGAPEIGAHRVAAAGAISALESGVCDQYSPVGGVPELREAIAAYECRIFGGTSPDALSEVAVATSATEALLAAFFALTDPGDEVLLSEPLFPWYPPQIRLAGATPVPVRMEMPQDDGGRFRFDIDAIAAAITPRTRVLVHNSPHNPTGAVATPAETERLARLCVAHDLICISDEVYHRHTFGGRRHVRIADEPGMASRTLTLNSAGKLLSCTGWRVGWMSGPAPLVEATNHYRGFASYCAPVPLQASPPNTCPHASALPG